jgi:hypothetical protein
MFLNAYQSGPAVEIISAQDKNPAWKLLTKGPSKVFDKTVKTYILNLATPTAKLLMPAAERTPLALVQPFLVLQVYLPFTESFTLEIGITDSSSTKRRLIFSSASKTYAITPLHARIPNSSFLRGTWANISIDLVSFVNKCFPGNSYRSTDSISLCALCRLRRVYTMRGPLLDTTEDSEVTGSTDEVPRNLDFPPGVDYLNQLVSADKAVDKQPTSPVKLPTAPMPKKAQTSVAFGKRYSQPPNSAQPRTLKSATPYHGAAFNTQTPFEKLPPATMPHPFSLRSSQALMRSSETRLGSAARRYHSKQAPKDEEEVLETPELLEDDEEPTAHDVPWRGTLWAPQDSLREVAESVRVDDEFQENPLELNGSFNLTSHQLTNMQRVSNDHSEYDSVDEEIEGSKDYLATDYEEEETKQPHPPLPDFYTNGMAKATDFRPFTPPFEGYSQVDEEEEAVELVYDPVLQCYYDPNTHEYYELDK